MEVSGSTEHQQNPRRGNTVTAVVGLNDAELYEITRFLVEALVPTPHFVRLLLKYSQLD